jgi:hypothetical protein
MDNSHSKDKGKKRVYPRPKRTMETGESSKTGSKSKTAASASKTAQSPTEEATKYGYYSFPPFPDSKPEESEAAIPPSVKAVEPESPSLASRFRNFFRSPPDEKKPEQKKPEAEQTRKVEHPPRTGVFLWCMHAFEDPCRCRNMLPPGDRGEYCQRCWFGACPGPAIPIPRSEEDGREW